MALKQYKRGQTYYGYDPFSGEGIAFPDEATFKQHFSEFDPNAPDLPVDPTIFNQSAGKLATGERDLSGIARQAGQAGVGLEELQKFLGTGVPAGTSDEIRNNLGIPRLEEKVFRPAPSTEQLFTDAYAAAGLADLKKKIEALTGEKTKVKNQLQERMLAVNENPWMSEASRLTNIGNTKNFFEGTIGNLQDEELTLSELFNQGLSQVSDLVGRKTTDFANQQAIDQAQLNYLLQKADAQLKQREALEAGKIGRYLPDYLQAKMRATKPDTITTEDGSIYQWDRNTGQFTQLVGPSTNKQLDEVKKRLEIEKLQKEINGEDDSWKAEILSAAEAKTLGVPFGTTKGQAASAGIIPETPLSAEMLKLQTNVKAGTDALSTIKTELFGEAAANTPIAQLNNVRSNVLLRQSTFGAKNYRFALDSAKDAIARIKTGANITTNEEKLFSKFLPGLTDNEATIKNKLRAFELFLISAGASEGGTVPESDSLFDEFESGGADKSSFLAPGGKTPYLKTLGNITAYGSSAWKPGLDVDVKKGQPVPSPVSGTVIAAKNNGGFGQQVQIKADDGRVIWLSHFDALKVKPGQKVQKGQLIALGGNTGNVIKGKGGDGSHVDITMPKPGGGYYTAKEVANYLNNIHV